MRSDNRYRVLKLINHDEQFRLNEDTAPVAPIILNLLDTSDPEYMTKLHDLVFADGAGQTFIARCQCGEMEGNNKIGMLCPACDTVVSPINLLDDNNLHCQTWLSCPEDLPGGWLAPKIYLNLVSWLSYGKAKGRAAVSKGKKSRNNYLDDILDVTTEIPLELRDVVHGKGFAYLYEHFDRIMDYFFHVHPVVSKKADTAAMKLCIQLNREKVFCHYIPVMNAAINPIVTQDSGQPNKKRYTDVTADFILNAVNSLSRLKYGPRRRNRMYQVERTTFRAYSDIIAYNEEAMTKYVSTKKAIPRTHIFGSRFHNSFRAVVVPIVEPHFVYEMHVPWKMAVNSLRVMIIGILIREHRLTINDAIVKVRKALQSIDADILTILNRLIDESPFPGIACVWDRPPSIRDGAVQLKFWTRIKTDLNDSCIGITSMDVALQNAD